MLVLLVQAVLLRSVQEHRVLVTQGLLLLALVQQRLVLGVTSVLLLALEQAARVARLRLLLVQVQLTLQLAVQ
jgi:hypothetical protein